MFVAQKHIQPTATYWTDAKGSGKKRVKKMDTM